MKVKISKEKFNGDNLLVVDVETQYLVREKVEFIESDKDKDNAITKLNSKMVNLPVEIESVIGSGDEVFLVHDKELHPSLENIKYTDLGNWEESEEWIDVLKSSKKRTAICGMWKELCCLEVYAELQAAGIDCYIIDDDNLTFSLTIYGSPLPLETKVLMFGYQIERL